MSWGFFPLLLAASCLSAADLPDVAARIGAFATEFRAKARMAISREVLLQRSYRLPHVPIISNAPEIPSTAFFQVHEVVSEYTLAPLKGDRSGQLVEFREILEKDGRVSQTPAGARKALETDIAAGEDHVRKKILTELTALGLVDVATDYGSILLAFTPAGQANLEIAPAGQAMIGADPVLAYTWIERAGTALDLRGRNQERRALHGAIYVRASDCLPLRITASFETRAVLNRIRDDATVDFVRAPFGAPVPATVVHRHIINDRVLTENLYTYAPFRLFGSDSTIRYADRPLTGRQ